MRATRALHTAILIWKRGLPLPVDLWAKLSGQGYDVAALEARHSV